MEIALLIMWWLWTNKFFPDPKKGWKFCCLSVVEIIFQEKVRKSVGSSALCLFTPGNCSMCHHLLEITTILWTWQTTVQEEFYVNHSGFFCINGTKKNNSLITLKLNVPFEICHVFLHVLKQVRFFKLRPTLHLPLHSLLFLTGEKSLRRPQLN